MSVRATSLIAALSLALAVRVGAGSKAEPFAWPEPPGAAAVAAAMKIQSETGVVLLDRRCTLDLGSINTRLPGGTREEFLRFLVVSEAGVRAANVMVLDDFNGSIETLEGRTVAPDGSVTAVDGTRDVTREEVSSFDRRRTSTPLAAVRFPAPRVGALLDLHYVTATKAAIPFYYYQALAYPGVPLVESHFDLKVRGGWPGFGWTVQTLGGARDSLALRNEGERTLIDVRGYSPPRAEPFSPPEHHDQLFMLVYLDLAPLRIKRSKPGVSHQMTLGVDSRGRLFGLRFADDRFKEYWLEYLKANEKGLREFKGKPGAAASLPVGAAAPAGAPLLERVTALYDLAQRSLEYDPDAEDVGTLAAAMKKGTDVHWHAAALLSYLLDTARIPHRVYLVADRYGIRFMPLALSEFLFGFGVVLAVDVPDRGEVFLYPADPTLPAGALPAAYQDAMALSLEGEDDIRVATTPANPAAADPIELRYDLALDGAGDAAGTVRLTEGGAPAVVFARWHRFLEFRTAHPVKGAKRWTEEERGRQLDRALEAELTVPGSLLTLSERRVAAGGERTVALEAAARGSGIAERSGDAWLVHAVPALAGYASPFSAERRSLAIWSPRGGRVVVEGVLRLPAGSRILELPADAEVQGPLDTRAACTFTAGEEGGAPVLRARVELDQPWIVPVDAYAGWRAFQAAIARIGETRALVRLPAAGKVLE